MLLSTLVELLSEARLSGTTPSLGLHRLHRALREGLRLSWFLFVVLLLVSFVCFTSSQ